MSLCNTIVVIRAVATCELFYYKRENVVIIKQINRRKTEGKKNEQRIKIRQCSVSWWEAGRMKMLSEQEVRWSLRGSLILCLSGNAHVPQHFTTETSILLCSLLFLRWQNVADMGTIRCFLPLLCLDDVLLNRNTNAN